MTTERAHHRAPRGLDADGRRFWREIDAGFELTAAELEILRQAALTVDELARLEAALAANEVTTLGSRGQTVANPLLSQIRAHRTTLGRLITALKLPGEETSAPPSAASLRASDVATRRWKMEKHRQATRGA
jgi:hypothetical protein